MKRNLIQIARIRMEEVVPGDVVNRVPEDTRGWFVAAVVEQLFDGTLQISDRTRHSSFSAGALDIVGVQLLKPIELEVTEDPGQILDALGGTHDTAIDAAAGSGGGASTEAAASGTDPATTDERLAVPAALTASAARTAAPVPTAPAQAEPVPRIEPQPVPAPVEARRTMRSLTGQPGS